MAFGHGHLAVTWDLLLRFATAVHIPNMVQSISQSLLTPLLPIMCRAAGYNDAIVGSVIAVSGIGRMSMSLPGALISERMGPVRTIQSAFVVYILACLLQVVVFDSLAILYVAFFIYGAANATYFVARHQLLAHIVERSERGRLMSLVGGAMRWGSVIAPTLAGIVISFASARWCLFLQAPLTALGLVALGASKKLREAEVKVKNSRTEAQGKWRAVIKCLWSHKGTVAIVGGYACTTVVMRSGRRLVLPLVALNFHLDPMQVGLVLSLGFVVDSCLFWLGGVIMDRFGRRAAAIPTMYMTVLAYLFLAFADTIPTFVACVVFFGIADSTGSGLLLTLIADTSPPEGGAPFIAVLRMIQDSGQFVGPLAIGLLMHHYSVRTACLTLAAFGSVVGLVALTKPFGPHAGDVGAANAATSRAARGSGQAFAALPDEDLDDEEEQSEMVGHAAVGGSKKKRRSADGASFDSVDLDLDDDDLALFNTVHPAATSFTTPRPASAAEEETL
jgi:MFS family permease